MVNFQSNAMSMVHFLTAMRYQLFLEKLNIAIVALIFLDHQERFFSIILLIYLLQAELELKICYHRLSAMV